MVKEDLISFNDAPPPEGKDVRNTKQLTPRTGPEPFLNDTNEEKRYKTVTKKIKDLGLKGHGD